MRQVVGAVALALTVACVKAPPVETPELPVETPDAWTTGEALAEEIRTEWWASFGDERLDAIVEEALENNYDLAAAAARLEQASADARIAAADLYPQLNATFNGSRRKQNFIGFPIPGGEDRVLSTTFTNLGVNLEASWEIDLWGRISAQSRASLASFQATAADLDAARLSLAGQTVKAWFAAAAASEQLRLAEATLESFRDSTDQVRERYEAGIRSPLDYRLSLANLAAAESNLYARRQQLDLAKRQIEGPARALSRGRAVDARFARAGACEPPGRYPG